MLSTPTKRSVRCALGALLALAGLKVAQAEVITLGGTGASVGTMKILAQAFEAGNREHRVKVLPSMGTGGGLKALQAGAVQLAMVARPLKEGEQNAGLVAHEYGRTPFVFTVQARSKVQAITTAQLADLYAGRQEHWPDGTRARLVMRPVGDSDNELIKTGLPALREAWTLAEQRNGMLFAVTDQDAADHAEKVDGALGTATLALLVSENRALRALPLNGVKPDPATTAAGQYPLFKVLYLAAPRQPSPGASAFLRFVASPAGRVIIVRNGHWITP
jgi:phosphate transport system substrate-binding protein